MKYILLLSALLPGLIGMAQSPLDFEDKILELMSEDNYSEAIAMCERAIGNKRYGQTPYFMLAEVYITAIPTCPRSKTEEYYLAMLAFDTYKRGHEYLGKHDPAVFNKICKYLPEEEWGQQEGLTSFDKVRVECYDKTSPVYFKSDCEEMKQH